MSKHCFTASVLAIAVSTVFAATPTENIATVGSFEKPMSSLTSERELQMESAPIRSKADLASYVSAFQQERSAFASLSVEGKQVFFESLRFNEIGLTGFNMRVLENELTATQIYKVLSLFGAQSLTRLMPNAKVVSGLDQHILLGNDSHKWRPEYDATDYPGYACAARATCSPSQQDICMSSC